MTPGDIEKQEQQDENKLGLKVERVLGFIIDVALTSLVAIKLWLHWQKAHL